MASTDSPFASLSRPLTVVVADDVVEIQELVRQWLTELGCIVTTVSTGSEAARILRSVHVDVLITDILMPEGDGLEVITALRRAQPSARVIAVSGGGKRLDANDCLRLAKGLGAHLVLRKPFNREELVEAVSQVISAPGRAAAR